MFPDEPNPTINGFPVSTVSTLDRAGRRARHDAICVVSIIATAALLVTTIARNPVQQHVWVGEHMPVMAAKLNTDQYTH